MTARVGKNQWETSFFAIVADSILSAANVACLFVPYGAAALVIIRHDEAVARVDIRVMLTPKSKGFKMKQINTRRRLPLAVAIAFAAAHAHAATIVVASN